MVLAKVDFDHAELVRTSIEDNITTLEDNFPQPEERPESVSQAIYRLMEARAWLVGYSKD